MSASPANIHVAIKSNLKNIGSKFIVNPVLIKIKSVSAIASGIELGFL